MAKKKSIPKEQNENLSTMRRHSYMRALSKELPTPPAKRVKKKPSKPKARKKSKKRS